MKYVRKFVDFYLYSSIHIALGAALSVVLCYAALTHIPTSDYPLFVFSSTLFLYCGHRIVGINKVKAFENEGRFAVIKKFRTHLILYAILSGLGSIYFYVNLTWGLKLWLIIPGIVSIFYVIPIFSKGKRLRDFSIIKIFLIAIIWGLVIGLIPYVEASNRLDGMAWIYFLEKVMFIFAITLPFDARDLEVDSANEVKTIPSIFGIKRAYKFSYLSMGLVIFCVIILYSQGVYSTNVALAIAIAYQVAGFAIQLSKNKTDDYYFSGILDGTIALVAIAGIVASGILKVMF